MTGNRSWVICAVLLILAILAGRAIGIHANCAQFAALHSLHQVKWDIVSGCQVNLPPDFWVSTGMVEDGWKGLQVKDEFLEVQR